MLYQSASSSISKFPSSSFQLKSRWRRCTSNPICSGTIPARLLRASRRALTCPCSSVSTPYHAPSGLSLHQLSLRSQPPPPVDRYSAVSAVRSGSGSSQAACTTVSSSVSPDSSSVKTITPVRSCASVLAAIPKRCVRASSPCVARDSGTCSIHPAPSRIVTPYVTLASTSTQSVCAEASTSRLLSPTRMAFFFCCVMVKRSAGSADWLCSTITIPRGEYVSLGVKVSVTVRSFPSVPERGVTSYHGSSEVSLLEASGTGRAPPGTAAEVREEQADGMLPESSPSGAAAEGVGSKSSGSSRTCHDVLVLKISSVLPPGLTIVAEGSPVMVR